MMAVGDDVALTVERKEKAKRKNRKKKRKGRSRDNDLHLHLGSRPNKSSYEVPATYRLTSFEETAVASQKVL